MRDQAESAGPAVAPSRGAGPLARAAGADHDNENTPLHRSESELTAYPSFVCTRMRAEVHVTQPLGGEVRVELGGCDVGVPEHLLQRA